MAEKTSVGRLMLLPLIICALGTVRGACGATLSVTFTPIPQGTDVDLTAEGPLDWVHWGLYTDSSLDRKAGVTPQIPDFIPKGFAGPFSYADNFNGYSWSDGTPTPAITNTTTGVWVYEKYKGFQLNLPADTTTRTLKVYVGTFGAQGEFEATLGGTRLKYSDTSISNVGNGPGGVYTLTCSADSPGQTLTVKFVVERTFDPAGNVTLQAATLTIPGANYPPTVRITSPADDDNFSAGSNIPILLDAADADGAIANVEFCEGATRLGESTASPYNLIWSNVAAGN